MNWPTKEEERRIGKSLRELVFLLQQCLPDPSLSEDQRAAFADMLAKIKAAMPYFEVGARHDKGREK